MCHAACKWMKESLEAGDLAVVEMFLQDGGLGEDFCVEAVFAAFFNIGGNVIRIEAFLGVAMNRLESRFIDPGFGFDGTHFAGKDAIVKLIENIKVFLDVTDVRDTGVGEENEPLTIRFEACEDRQHAGVLDKNICRRAIERGE